MIYRIVTNNPLVQQCVPSLCKMDMVTGDAEAVFSVVENALQNHWKLLTSPLPPNVPLIRSPVRTVVLQSHLQRYDVPGLHCLCKAKERTTTLGKAHRPELHGDLECIDHSFALRALRELGFALDNSHSASCSISGATLSAVDMTEQALPQWVY